MSIASTSSGQIDDSERGTLVLAGNPDWTTNSEELQRRCSEMEDVITQLQDELKEYKQGPKPKAKMDLAISRSGAFPMLLAMAEAADLAESGGEGLLQKSVQIQEECERAIEHAEQYEKRIHSLESCLHQLGVDPKEVDNYIEFEHTVTKGAELAKIKELEQIKDSLMKDLECKQNAVTKHQMEKQEAVLAAAAIKNDLEAYRSREKQMGVKLSNLQESLQDIESANKDYQGLVNAIIQLCEPPTRHDLTRLIPSMPIHRISHDVQQEVVTAIESALMTKVSQFSSSIDIEHQLKQSTEQIMHLRIENESMKNCKIAFRRFDVNDLALFLPTAAPGTDGRVYLAFHLGCPHRYLSEESISSFQEGETRYRDYILGKIVYIDEHVADEEFNPFNLSFGTTFYVLTVAKLTE